MVLGWVGVSLEYPKTGPHAISRDGSAYLQEHLYVMVNGKLTHENEARMNDEDEDWFFLHFTYNFFYMCVKEAFSWRR